MKTTLWLGTVVFACVLGCAACAGTGGEEAAEADDATGAAAEAPEAVPPASPAVADADRVRATAERPPATAIDVADFDRTLEAAERRIDAIVREPVPEDAESLRRREVADSAMEAYALEHLDRLLEGAADARDPVRRCACVKALAYANDRRATAVAVTALRSEGDAALRTAAGFALARLADPDTDVPALVAAIRDRDADVRVNALTALARVLDARGAVGNFIDVRTRDELLPVLETALFDPEDASVRGRAAAAARALGEPRLVPSLVNLLRDKDPFVRTHTALALSRYGDRDEVPPLVEVIDDTPEGPARTAVVGALERILRREGIDVPAGIPDTHAAWSDFVRRALTEKDRQPLR